MERESFVGVVVVSRGAIALVASSNRVFHYGSRTTATASLRYRPRPEKVEPSVCLAASSSLVNDEYHVLPCNLPLSV